MRPYGYWTLMFISVSLGLLAQEPLEPFGYTASSELVGEESTPLESWPLLDARITATLAGETVVLSIRGEIPREKRKDYGFASIPCNSALPAGKKCLAVFHRPIQGLVKTRDVQLEIPVASVVPFVVDSTIWFLGPKRTVVKVPLLGMEQTAPD